MHVRDGKVYVIHVLQEALVAYDIATGNRTAISVAGEVGAGDHALGQNNIFWDESRDLMWVIGSPAPFIGFAVDLASGDRDSIYRISPGGLLPGEYPVGPRTCRRATQRKLYWLRNRCNSPDKQ